MFGGNHSVRRIILAFSGISSVLLINDAALARDVFVGPRAEVRATWSSLLANDYDAGYCYVYVGSDQCVSYPSKKLSSMTSVGGELGYDAPLSGNATIGVYGRYDFGSGENQNGAVRFKVKDNYALGVKLGYGRNRANGYFKLGYQNWKVETTVLDSNIGALANAAPAFTRSSQRGGIDIALGVDVRVAKRFYIGGELGGGVLSKDMSTAGLDTTLKTLRLAVKVGTHF